MSKIEISKQLRTLADDDSKRPLAARLRDVIDDVEHAIEMGISRKLILETLRKNGLVMTMATFDTTLSRIRKKRRGGMSHVQRASKQTDRTGVTPGGAKLSAPGSSTSPVELDKVIASTPDLEALAKVGRKKR